MIGYVHEDRCFAEALALAEPTKRQPTEVSARQVRVSAGGRLEVGTPGEFRILRGAQPEGLDPVGFALQGSWRLLLTPWWWLRTIYSELRIDQDGRTGVFSGEGPAQLDSSDRASTGTFYMLPWVNLAKATAPEGGTLRLLRRGDEFSIRLEGGNELMNSRLGGSEEALATLALDRLASRPAPRVLIGGLGMGFTLRAAQAAAPPDARLIVVEIVPELADWASLHMAEVFGDCLSDLRVEVRIGDVGTAIKEATGEFDAILLDVDNGPDGLTRADNDALYGEAGLTAAHRALTPSGVLAVWSAAPDPDFAKRLIRCGFDVSAHTVRAGRTKRGTRHTIWIAVRAGW